MHLKTIFEQDLTTQSFWPQAVGEIEPFSETPTSLVTCRLIGELEKSLASNSSFWRGIKREQGMDG
jgi:hypothetical protein